MQEKKNKKVGFFLRLLYTTIDISIFCFIGIISSFVCLNKIWFNELDTHIFLVNNFYYLWLFIVIFSLIFLYILIPLFTKGRTIGMLITRTKYLFETSFKKFMIKKLEIGVSLWIFVLLLFCVFISPTIIDKQILYNYLNKNFSLEEINKNPQLKELFEGSLWNTIEIICYTIPTVIPPFIILFQLFLLISSGFSKSKVSFFEKITLSQIVYSNKFQVMINEIKSLIQPEKEIKLNIVFKGVEIE